MFTYLPKIEKEFLLNQIADQNRLSGRNFNEYRDIYIKKLENPGQVIVDIGDTSVYCQIFSSLVSPQPDRPNEGIIMFNLDLSHLKHVSETNNCNEKLGILRNRISNILEKSLKDTKCLDTASLCVVYGKLVWKIVLNINVINYSGNLYDCIYLAVICSWLTYKIPFMKRSENYVVDSNKMIYLPIISTPICVTTALINGQCIVDPDLEEENLANGLIVMCYDKFEDVKYIHSFNSCQFSNEQILEMLNMSKVWVKEIYSKIITLKNNNEVIIKGNKIKSLFEEKRNEELDVDMEINRENQNAIINKMFNKIDINESNHNFYELNN